MDGSLGRILFKNKEYKDKIYEEFYQYVTKSYGVKKDEIDIRGIVVVNVFGSGDTFNFDIKFTYYCDIDQFKGGIFNEKLNKDLYLYCICKIDLSLTDFEIIKPYDTGHTFTSLNNAIGYNENLVPRDKKYPLYADAKRLLKRFYSDDEINHFSKLPIIEIINKLGLYIIDNFILSDEDRTHGMICMVDTTLTLKDAITGRMITKDYKAGTIFVDSNYKKKYGIKSVNFTLAHEIYHWLRHKHYFALQRVLDSDKAMRPCKIGIKYFWLNDDERIEVQANKFASTLLLFNGNWGTDTFFKLYNNDYYKDIEYKYDLFRDTLSKVSNDYDVSKSVLILKLASCKDTYKEVEYLKDEYKNYFSSYRDKYSISLFDLYDLYLKNSKIEELINSGHFAYYKQHLVLNNDKILTKNKNFTSFVRNNLNKCFVEFSYIYGINNKSKFKDVLNRSKYIKTIDYISENNINVMEYYDLIMKDTNEVINGLKNKTKLYDIINYLIKQREYKNSDLVEESWLSEKTISRYRSQAEHNPLVLFQALQLVVGFHMEPDVSRTFLGKFDLSISSDKIENRTYRFLVNSCYYQKISEWNKILKKANLPEFKKSVDVK